MPFKMGTEVLKNLIKEKGFNIGGSALLIVVLYSGMDRLNNRADKFFDEILVMKTNQAVLKEKVSDLKHHDKIHDSRLDDHDVRLRKKVDKPR